MAPQRKHTRTGPQRRALATLAAAALVAAGSLAGISAAPGARLPAAARGESPAPAYGWPVQPFDRPHPVRANFGDPRTTFDGPRTVASVMEGGGVFSFHFGIDIAVPDGTAVYSVRSGTASLLGTRNVQVDSGSGFRTQYWHIVPAVTEGQHVVARETVLGHVLQGYEHVHFSELEDGRYVNPLAPGHLGPYDDGVAPQVSAISFRIDDSVDEAIPESVSGAVVPVVRAQDVPTRRAPGMWAGLPVAPALLEWRIERANDGAIAVPTRTAFDARTTVPRDRAFWSYYARGSRQNMARFAHHRAWRTPGTYLFRLTTKPFDTRQLPNGIYSLVVTASDVRGNTSSLEQIFIVRNGVGP